MTRMSAAIQLAWSAETGKASVNDHQIAFSHDHVVLVFQRVRQIFNEPEKSVASRSNVGTVLNVIR
jgi:ABC-type antimicrobial peptide transport system ATPase subunit